MDNTDTYLGYAIATVITIGFLAIIVSILREVFRNLDSQQIILLNADEIV